MKKKKEIPLLSFFTLHNFTFIFLYSTYFSSFRLSIPKKTFSFDMELSLSLEDVMLGE